MNKPQGQNDRTITISCAHHPHWRSWPIKNLITGACPECHAHVGPEGRTLARLLRAARLIKDRP